MTRPVRALIFDMDGTLVDNMAAHQAAWGEWHRRRGLPFDPDAFFPRTAGRADVEIIADLLPDHDAEARRALSDEKQAIYRELYAPRRALLPGLAAVMDAADARGVPMAVATAAPPPNVDFILDGLGVRHRFKAVVFPAQGHRGKPHPDIFLAAARGLGVAAPDCLVFEDAPLGVEAARRADMGVVAVTTTLPASAFAGLANVVEVRADLVGFDLAGRVGSAGPAP